MPLFIKVAYNLRFCRLQGLSVDCVERGSLFYFKVFLDNPDNIFYIDSVITQIEKENRK